MALNFTTAVNHARASALITAAGSNPLINIYTGFAPANADATASGTLLCTLTVSGALGTDTAGNLTFNTTPTAYILVSGVAGYARLTTSGGVTIHDFTSITDSTGNGDLQLSSTTTLTQGGLLSLTTGTQFEPYP